MNRKTKSLSYLIVFLISTTLFVFCDGNNEEENESCDFQANETCTDGKVCELTGPQEGTCLQICDTATGEPCNSDQICYKYVDNNACISSCNVSDNDSCAEGWICTEVGLDKNICRPSCASIPCTDGEVCQPLSDGQFACVTPCDPLDKTTCGENKVCELRTDNLYACYDPVYIKGNVFDSTNNNPIENAHVIAIDKTGAPVTDVAITDAQGMYELAVPVTRNPDGTLNEGVFTLRVFAQNYIPFPHGIRPAIPIDATGATITDNIYVLQNASTDVALIPLSVENQNGGIISGKVILSSQDKTPGGVLVVVEGGTEDPPLGFSDLSGNYTIFNVQAGTCEVKGYKAFLQLDPVSNLNISAGETKTDVNLIENNKPYATVSGSINLVNPGDGNATSIVLVPESTFNETFTRGEVPTGLRAPLPPQAPSITNAFTIEGVPDGNYVVLAAFENDFLVRDPDPGIAGTQIVHIQIPDGENYIITIGDSFKVTGALTIVSPGSESPEPVSGTPTFIWKDDSSEDFYTIVLYNAYGEEVWRNDSVPKVSGSANVEVTYDGTDQLEVGMYYQFRATSFKETNDGADPISMTEDLLGVFYIIP